MCATSDGFELAEADMRMRGPGDFEGTRQSGLAIDLHIADLGRDGTLLDEVRSLAQAVLEDDPSLGKPQNALLKKALAEQKMEIKDYSNIS